MRLLWSVVYLIASVSLCLELVFALAVPEDGSSCEVSEDSKEYSSGKCVPVVDCEPAKNAIRKNKRHDFKRCGFRGWNEFVCCPVTTSSDLTLSTTSESHTTRNSTTTESATQARQSHIRKSYQACEELSNEIGPKLSFQILGGVDAKAGEFPHMAALGYQVDDNPDDIAWQCGGALISNQFVLTAAHCIAKQDDNPPVKVRLGIVDIAREGNAARNYDYAVDNFTIHPQFNRRLKLNDIALIRLSRPVRNNENINPACLYHKSDDPPKGLVITGWGLTKIGGEGTPVLQKGSLVPVSVTKCNQSYTTAGRSISRKQICAISSDGKIDACQGDSGGPLQIQSMHSSSVYSIVGITSFGRGCGGTYPGVYVRVYSYLDWIESIVWPN